MQWRKTNQDLLWFLKFINEQAFTMFAQSFDIIDDIYDICIWIFDPLGLPSIMQGKYA